MTAIPLDLSGFRDTSGSKVPEGTYTVTVGAVDVGVSKAGNTMITLFLDIVGDGEGAPTEFNGLTIPDRLTITQNAMFRVVQFLNAIGIPTPRARIQIVPESWVGKRLLVDLADGEPYRGRVKSEVAGYSRAKAAPAAEPVDPMAAFGSLAATPAANEPAPAASPVPEPTDTEALDAAAALADRVQAAMPAAAPEATSEAPIDMDGMDLSKL